MPSRTIAIRLVRMDDAPALARLTVQLGYPTTPSQMAERLSRMDAAPDRATFVADLSGEIVGYAGIWSGMGYEADAPHARVMALVVDPSRRRSGVGTALMGAAESWGRKRGVAVIVLNSGEARVDAHAFYERLGYQHTGRRYLKHL